MLMGMGTMVSAAEKESSIPEYSETNDGGMTVNIAGDQEGTILKAVVMRKGLIRYGGLEMDRLRR
ncbi:hypothetical protein BACPEC_02540 [[Bacteroides] pectinophilus ATCC 43243]|uniref:Uncharacterized protein n=1 Tax=[Bacteroides] pectinophilus ATCC 43243 TaxID=483218 RepID=B7AUZ2_9FIRM|nr:hypothetical protein BACPEC_02540 [[Bacteroides] pectinophilus ATCC 43243]